MIIEIAVRYFTLAKLYHSKGVEEKRKLSRGVIALAAGSEPNCHIQRSYQRLRSEGN